MKKLSGVVDFKRPNPFPELDNNSLQVMLKTIYSAAQAHIKLLNIATSTTNMGVANTVVNVSFCNGPDGFDGPDYRIVITAGREGVRLVIMVTDLTSPNRDMTLLHYYYSDHNYCNGVITVTGTVEFALEVS